MFKAGATYLLYSARLRARNTLRAPLLNQKRRAKRKSKNTKKNEPHFRQLENFRICASSRKCQSHGIAHPYFPHIEVLSFSLTSHPSRVNEMYSEKSAQALSYSCSSFFHAECLLRHCLRAINMASVAGSLFSIRGMVPHLVTSSSCEKDLGVQLTALGSDHDRRVKREKKDGGREK